jgi:predicted transcriptional regulator
MIDRRLVGIASDSLKVRVLGLLTERTAGVGEVAEELAADVSAIATRIDQMHEAGLVEVVGEVLNRGAVEPRYRALVRLLWEEDDWRALGNEEQKRLTHWIIDTISSDAHEANEAGTFNARPESHASRTVSLVDEQGWRELIKIQDDVVAAIFDIQAASAERLAIGDEEGFAVMAAMLCCEMPPRESTG